MPEEVMPLITDDIVAEVEKIFKDNVERDSEFIMNTARQLQLMRIAYRKGKLNQRDADQKWRKVQHNLNLKFFKERVEAIHAFYKRYLETKEKEARLQGITECANQVEELLAAGIFNEAAITVNLSSVLNYIASHPEQIHNVPPLTQLRQIAEGK